MRDLGQTMFDQGYRIVAIKPGDKGTFDPGWTRFGHQQTQPDIDRLIRKYPAYGIGIITAWTPAIDIEAQ
jgi:hypothetical protein